MGNLFSGLFGKKKNSDPVMPEEKCPVQEIPMEADDVPVQDPDVAQEPETAAEPAFHQIIPPITLSLTPEIKKESGTPLTEYEKMLQSLLGDQEKSELDQDVKDTMEALKQTGLIKD